MIISYSLYDDNEIMIPNFQGKLVCAVSTYFLSKLSNKTFYKDLAL